MSKLPEHLFIGCEGHMYDTRREDWVNHPLRWNYTKLAPVFPLTPKGSIALRASIRDPYAFPGGYESVFITNDGGCLCHQCARDNYKQVAYSRRNYCNDGWQVVGAMLVEEVEEELNCDHCKKVLVQYEEN